LIKASTYRLQYLDWLRGFGALIMLQGHVFDSFLKPEMRAGDAYMLSQFVGGMPPAIFLFLTGVTLAFLMDSSERKGLAPRERVFTAFRRSGYLFSLAFAFRLQLWIFGFPAPLTDLFKVDILNCMGFAIAVLSVFAFLPTAARVRWCAGTGLAIAAAGPLISGLSWSHIPPLVRDYLVPSQSAFGFFPWAAYLAFGISAGSIIRTLPRDGAAPAMRWIALGGGVLILVCQVCARFGSSPYRHSEFWLNSPVQVLAKQGVTMVMLGFAFLWTRHGESGGWSWIRQFGATSLLVYWVHIELVYGRGLFFLKNSLTVPQTLVAAPCVILLMLAISYARTHWYAIRRALSDWGWWYLPNPERVPGD
jgi:hypothetical protein